MRVLVFGGTGMLGREVVREARSRGHAALGLSHPQADVTDRAVVAEWLERFAPQWIVNCAALTNVDACESRLDEAMAVNGRAPGLIAEAAQARGARLLQVSTDYVFDGTAATPLAEDAPTGPLSVYGASKLEGERRALAATDALVVRTSLVFGAGGENFVAAMARLARSGNPLRVVTDQVGCPTYSRFLARALLDLAAVGARGIVHYGNQPGVSRFELARAIAAAVAPGTDIEPCLTAEFPRPAARPAYSVFDVTRFELLVGRPVEPWSWGLGTYLSDLA